MSAEISWSGVEKGLATGQQRAWLVWGRCLEDCRGSGTALSTGFRGMDMVLTPVAIPQVILISTMNWTKSL